ncbi:MAG: DUF3185 domain-containing protein [Candidatus Eisenbacteria bacterium]
MKLIAVILIVLGFLGLVYGGFSYTREKKVVDVGPLEVTADQKHTMPVSPLIGGIALLAGALLLITDRRRA